MRVIFLDFDGVLHPRISPDKLFVHVDRLSHVLKDHPDVKIVVSSSGALPMLSRSYATFWAR
ncbi:MAG: hypothetical protein IPL70_15690 [Uliginosibacterium sp.]|nr:hypothetical protein [Uliginosibacterium sp.]